jgi:hypothetical protein
MDEALHATLARWGDFYVITGTAAAALTGLQFVVQTLIASGASRQAAAGDDAEAGIAAFGTPTVVHFSLALVLSGVLSMPWPGEGPLRVTLALLGAGALIYSAVVLRRARRQQGYAPVFEDWVWHVVLPGMAYAAVLLAALFLERNMTAALFSVAAATLLLVCVGIHNAWDTVVYLTVGATQQASTKGPHTAAPRNEPVARRKRRR